MNTESDREHLDACGCARDRGAGLCESAKQIPRRNGVAAAERHELEKTRDKLEITRVYCATK